MAFLDRLRRGDERTTRFLVGAGLGVAGLGLAGLIVLLVVLISGLQQVDARTAALQDAVVGGADAPIQGTVDDVERRLRGLRSGEDASIARVVDGLVTVTDRLDVVSRRLGDVAGDTDVLSSVGSDLSTVARSIQGIVDNTGALSAVAADLGAVRRNTRTIGDLEARLVQVVVQLDRLQGRLAALGPIRRSLEAVERDVDRIERSIPGPVVPAGK